MRERSVEEWKVAAIGPSAAHRASTATLGVNGSCTWMRSNSPASSQRPTLAAATGPKLSRATEPFHGTPTARPAETM